MIRLKHIRLINRMLIKPGKTLEVINLSEAYDIPISISTYSNYSSSPCIERLYKRNHTNINIQTLTNFLNDLLPHLEMYRGSLKPFTYAEISLKYVQEKEDENLEGKSELVMYCNASGNVEITPFVAGSCFQFQLREQVAIQSEMPTVHFQLT